MHSLFVFFFNDTAPTEIYTLSLHDALPIYFETATLLAVTTRHCIFAKNCANSSRNVRAKNDGTDGAWQEGSKFEFVTPTRDVFMFQAAATEVGLGPPSLVEAGRGRFGFSLNLWQKQLS